MKKDSITTLRAKIKECKLNRNRAIKAGQIYSSFYWANVLDKHLQNLKSKMRDDNQREIESTRQATKNQREFIIGY